MSVCFCLSSALAAADAAAAESAPPIQTGIDLKLDTTAGWRDGVRIGSSLSATALAHLDWQPKAMDGGITWHGYLSALLLAGRGPSGKYLGDFLAADNTEAPESQRMYAWWLEAAQGPWNIRTGALLADEEFATTECGGHFLNSALGWPAFISANTVNTGPAYFVAALGARLSWTPNEKSSWQVGVYDGDAVDSPDGNPNLNRHGIHYRLGGSQGWFILGETTWQPSGPNANILKAGVWYHTAEFSDVYRDGTGTPHASTGKPPVMHDGNYGAYASIEHAFSGKYGEAGSSSGHVRIGVSPADRNALTCALDVGMHWHGLIPGRPEDAFGLAYVFAKFSPDYAANARLLSPADPAPDHESVIEAVYDYTLKPGISLQPDIQWINHTGGSPLGGNSLLFILRFNAAF